MNTIIINLSPKLSNNKYFDLFLQLIVNVFVGIFCSGLFNLVTYNRIIDYIFFLVLYFLIDKLINLLIQKLAIELIIITMGTILFFVSLISFGIVLQVFANLVVFNSIFSFIVFYVLFCFFRGLLNKGLVYIRKRF